VQSGCQRAHQAGSVLSDSGTPLIFILCGRLCLGAGELFSLDEEQRIAIFEMVKDGSMSIEDAHAEVCEAVL
jgi:hypothetical protein